MTSGDIFDNLYKLPIFLISKMTFTKQEKEIIKFLVKRELKDVEKKEEEIKTESPVLLAAEEKYEIVLEKMLKKLE